MKKSSFLFLLIVLGMVGGAASAMYYFWSQLTALPEWYRSDRADSRSVAEIQKSSATVVQKIQAQTQAVPQKKNSNVQVALNSQELNDLLVTKMAEKNAAKPILNSVKGMQTTVQNDTLKTGGMVDVNALKTSNLGAKEKQLLSEFTEKIPAGDRRLYIGVEGKPKIQNGTLKFTPDTKIRVGNMRFTLTEAAARMGVPVEQLQEQLNLELKLGSVKDIDFQNDTAVLKGAAETLQP